MSITTHLGPLANAPKPHNQQVFGCAVKAKSNILQFTVKSDRTPSRSRYGARGVSNGDIVFLAQRCLSRLLNRVLLFVASEATVNSLHFSRKSTL